MSAKGIDDSVDEALEYLEAIGGSSWDRSTAQTYVSHLPEVLAFVEAVTSLRWVTYSGLPDYFTELPGGRREGRVLLPLPASKSVQLMNELASHPEMALVRRSLHSPGFEDEWMWGRVLIAGLWARILDRKIDYRLDAEVVELQPNGGSSMNVIVDEGGVLRRYVARRGVLLNTGGCEWNTDLMQANLSSPIPWPQTPPSNTGDGQLLAQRLGASLTMMDRTIGIPSVRVTQPSNDGEPLYRLFFQPLAKPHSLVVNSQGERFANETFFPSVVDAWREVDESSHLINLPCYFVFDSQYVERFGTPPGLVSVDRFYTAETLRELESLLRIPEGALSATVAQYNSSVAGGGADAFGRGATAYQRAFGDHQAEGVNPTVGDLRTGPFHAVELHPSTSGHRGGVCIDNEGHVIGSDGNAIAGLFACGNVAAGSVTGDVYISGASIGHALVFGHLAARAMARQ